MTNYVKGRKGLKFDSDDAGIIDNKPTNENYLLLESMSTHTENDNLESYIESYTRYMNDKIYGFFSYTEHPPSYCDRQFYPLCVCAGATEDEREANLVYVHRYLYELKCNCKDGKRYLALRNAYEIELKKKFTYLEEANYMLYTIKGLFDTFNADIHSFEKSDIIKFIESSGPIDFDYIEWVPDKDAKDRPMETLTEWYPNKEYYS